MASVPAVVSCLTSSSFIDQRFPSWVKRMVPTNGGGASSDGSGVKMTLGFGVRCAPA
jgi:hypothetical protein